ncbi:MAG: fatty acid CoA ligase family protein [Desulfobacterales bacterium]|jgi:acyl-CoA synthetase (AMP-forming)/AMP-acid ligase II
MPTIDHPDQQALVNIAYRLRETARRLPFKRAVVYPVGRDRFGRPTYAHLTFEQLERDSDSLAAGLETTGIQRGTKTVLMVKPGIEFFVLIFAMFKCGAVPVVVDPGMGLRRMIRCLASTRPEAFIGIPLAHMVRVGFPKYFTSIQTHVTVGPRWCWGGATLEKLYLRPWRSYAMAATTRDETAAILFTTGSTGPAKGVVYTHGNFDAQVRQIQTHFAIGDDEIDLPTFPLFALFDPALGMTAVIPDMDPRKPAQVDPENIIAPILNHGVTNMFASPALLNRVGAFGKKRGVRLPSLRRVVSAGAPVAPANIEQFSSLLTETCEIHTPYGATEAVPIISMGSHEILNETRALSEQGYGMCVGRPIGQTDVRIIRITDEPIANWSDALPVADGDIGEIVVRGDLVTRRYYRDEKADALAKIADGDTFWHRMGDLGWRDSKNRIWFCGRKSHRVGTPAGDMFTIPCEALFNNHPGVYRSALVGIGPRPRQVPIICIERSPEGHNMKRRQLREELLAIAAASPLTRNIRQVLFQNRFPVDIRHNSKIFREQLAVWAEGRVTPDALSQDASEEEPP